MNKAEISNLDWEKGEGLLPAIVQHARSGRVLMLAYVNREALTQCFELGQAVFYSRSRDRLWMKGETSGNTLAITAIDMDCDCDTLLLRVQPAGPTCHLGATSCFPLAMPFLESLEDLVQNRLLDQPDESYTARLAAGGISAVAQKVGEEAVEVVLAAMASDSDHVAEEAADLLFHLIVLLRLRELSLDDAVKVLQQRNLAVDQASSHDA